MADRIGLLVLGGHYPIVTWVDGFAPVRGIVLQDFSNPGRQGSSSSQASAPALRQRHCSCGDAQRVHCGAAGAGQLLACDPFHAGADTDGVHGADAYTGCP